MVVSYSNFLRDFEVVADFCFRVIGKSDVCFRSPKISSSGSKESLVEYFGNLMS